jgi:hypothetical protein
LPNSQDSPFVSAAPQLLLAWLPEDAAKPHPVAISVPLYLGQDRSKVVAELQLPVTSSSSSNRTVEQQQWVLAGTALVLPA